MLPNSHSNPARHSLTITNGWLCTHSSLTVNSSPPMNHLFDITHDTNKSGEIKDNGDCGELQHDIYIYGEFLSRQTTLHENWQIKYGRTRLHDEETIEEGCGCHILNKLNLGDHLADKLNTANDTVGLMSGKCVRLDAVTLSVTCNTSKTLN